MSKDSAWGGQTSGRWHTFFGDTVSNTDFIDIHPTPDSYNDTMVIWFYEETGPIDYDDLSASPLLDYDYWMLFVYFMCKEIAENYRDYDIANGFADQYNQLYREFQGVFQKPEVITVHSESGW